MRLLDLKEMIRTLRFSRKSLIVCGGCGKKITESVRGLPRTHFVLCPWCNYENFVPFRLGRFWLYKPLGVGGVGCVCKAFDAKKIRLCAVKILRHDDISAETERIESYKREISALASIGRHSSIVRMLAHGNINNEYYCAMKFINGWRLDELIADGKHFNEENVVKIILRLIAVEKYIYRKGFLYRDIKPENIIIRRNWRPVLFDFGLCQPKEKVSAHVDADFVDGSAHYMPPERLKCDPEGPWSEIYSLGMLMYEMLTGEKFIKSTVSEEALTKKHVAGLRVSAAELLKDLCTPSLAMVIDKMTHREPKERYQSFDELEQVLAGKKWFLFFKQKKHAGK